MLEVFRKKFKHAKQKKKEYFTVMILPGPSSKVRKFSIEKTFLRNLGIALLVAIVASTVMMGEYFHMQGQVWELDTLRAETTEQRQQIKVFATNIIDMKGQMAQIQNMSDKIKSLAKFGGGDKSQQRLGIGGSSEMSSLNIDELGKKTHKELMNQMSEELDGLKAAAAEQEAGMQKLTDFLEHRNSVMAATPNIWPVRGFITSSFGYRQSPIYGTRQFHQGLDIANNIGTPVHAPANGTVAETGYQTGYGRYIKIQHGYGVATVYGHLSKSNVRAGERVKKGDRIGAVGNTGSSTGPHLHYEVRVNGVPRNPKNYL